MELLVRVYHLGASPIYGMTSVSCMFCKGRLGQVPSCQGSSVLFHSMLKCSPCLANVDLLTVAAWDPVDHSCPLVSGDVVFETHQHLFEGTVLLKAGTNLQGRQDPADGLREVPDIRDHYRGLRRVL